MKLLAVTFLIGCVLVLGACQQAVRPQTQQSSPSKVAPSHTSTAVVVQFETITVLPTQSYIGTPPPTPINPAFNVSTGLILSTGTAPTCDLPCWNDLRIGQSTQDDAQRVLTRIFNADDDFDFFTRPATIPLYLQNVAFPEGFTAGGHYWEFEDSKTGIAGTYSLHVEIDQRTKLLSGIVEVMGSFTTYDVPALPEVVTRLGSPSRITLSPYVTDFGMFLYYQEGIRVSLYLAKHSPSGDYAEICLDEDPHTIMFELTDPYESFDSHDFSPMQAAWEFSDTFRSIEEIVGLSVEKFVELAKIPNTCIQVPR